MKTYLNFSVVLSGSRDFLRRVQGSLNSSKCSFLTCNPSEISSTIASEKPDALILEIGVNINKTELLFLKKSLYKIKSSKTKVILAVTSSRKLAYAGELLFETNSSLHASELIDDLIITPPGMIPSIASLEEQIANCLEYLHIETPPLWSDYWAPSICSPKSREIWKKWLPRYASYINESPLIVGATGSGKTRMAIACHHLSGATGPFVTITPRDFSSSELIQAELFGSVAGAFTGSIEKWGLVKKAEKGTLFIDELQSIDLDLQGKLITFIENKKYRRVGESEDQKANVRFVFASNQPLEKLVLEKKLRDDFAYRLERLQIPLLSLSERRLDIPAGAAFSIAKIARERNLLVNQDESATSLPIEGFSIDSYQKLFSTEWPGNLRQLENAVAKSIELNMMNKQNSKIIELDTLEQALEELLVGHAKDREQILQIAFERSSKIAKDIPNLSQAQNTFAQQARALALESTGGKISEASALIGDSEKAMKLYASRTGSFQREKEHE